MPEVAGGHGFFRLGVPRFFVGTAPAVKSLAGGEGHRDIPEKLHGGIFVGVMVDAVSIQHVADCEAEVMDELHRTNGWCLGDDHPAQQGLLVRRQYVGDLERQIQIPVRQSRNQDVARGLE